MSRSTINSTDSPLINDGGERISYGDGKAIREPSTGKQACVILKPDGIDQFTIPAEFAKEDPDYYEDGIVKADILDHNIWWFRD